MIEFFSDAPHKTVRTFSRHYVFDLQNGNVPPWFRNQPQENGLYGCFDAHAHEFIEIIAVVRGSIIVDLGDIEHTFHTGEVMIVNPYTVHCGHLADASQIKNITAFALIPTALHWIRTHPCPMTSTP